MKYIKKINWILPVAAFIFSITSCNKTLVRYGEPITFPLGSGTQTITDFISTDANYTFLLAALKRAVPVGGAAGDLLAALGRTTNIYTVFAADNNAFIASGIPSTAAIATLRTGQLDSLLRYHIIPGRQYLSTDIPITFPNLQLPSLLPVGILTGTVPFDLSLYPSRRSNGFWVNNIPITAGDKTFLNGVIHTTAALVTPPSLLLGFANGPGVLSDPQYALFDSLIVRGDVGNTNITSTFNYALNQAFASLTVFAPTNTAVKTFLTAATGGAIPSGSPDAVYASYIRTGFPAASAQGIVAYHILPVKAYSNNFFPTPTITPTLVPPSLNPGISVQAFFTGPLVDSLKVLGLAPSNGGIPATSKPRSNFDKNAINGVVHTIDKVLLPQ
ncbi:MAG: fasciclin domain-containing protein [Bacteroidota bacterium]|nr:fasciclin domain-containing protein [Bacteroidota bacterium]